MWNREWLIAYVRLIAQVTYLYLRVTAKNWPIIAQVVVWSRQWTSEARIRWGQMELPTDPLSPTRITARCNNGAWRPSKTVGPLSPNPGQRECSEGKIQPCACVREMTTIYRESAWIKSLLNLNQCYGIPRHRYSGGIINLKMRVYVNSKQ